ncbi:MAG: hypothetical protein MJ214_00620 [Bacilli bacterium]|nr:hypothetical protein [Bacilli bacterium]
MIQYNYLIPLILIIVLFLTVILFIVTGRTTYYANEKTRFSFRNRFPFELNYQRNITIVSYFRLFLIFLFALCVGFPILFATSFRGASNVAYATVIAFFFIASALVDLVLFFIRPTYLKQFKIYSTLAITLTMMAEGMIGVFFLTSIYTHIAFKVMAGIAFALMGFNLLMAINPKLSRWDCLEESKNKDGTMNYVRPKISPLAFSLWLNFLTLVIGEFILLISLLLSGLGY